MNKPIKERAKDYINSLDSISEEEFDEFLDRWAVYLKERKMEDNNKHDDFDWVQKQSWREFQMTGLLWWINMALHTFGWAICYDVNDDNEIISVYPARIKYRGFSRKIIEDGYEAVSKYMKDNAKTLYKESKL